MHACICICPNASSMYIHSLGCLGTSVLASALALSVLGASLFGAIAEDLGGGETFCLGGRVNLALTTFPSICACI